MSVRVNLEFDDGDIYVVTESMTRDLAARTDAPWLIDNFEERCVTITDEEHAEWQRLENVMLDAKRAYVDYIYAMGRSPNTEG